MEESTSKEKILKKIRKALIHKSEVDYTNVDFDSDVYTYPEESPELLFAQKFSQLNGKFVFCESEKDFSETFATLVAENKWQNIFAFETSVKKILTNAKVKFEDDSKKIANVEIGVTLCEYLVSRTGTVMVSSKQDAGRRLGVYSNTHIVVAYTSQLVSNVKDALSGLKKKYEKNFPSLVTAITGPSRTADIEKTLVQGAHGPKDIFVFLIDDTGRK